MKTLGSCVKLYTIKDGYLICPVCRRNKRLLKIDAETSAHRLPVYCRDCKSRIYVDIDEGQCFESRSQ